MSELKGRGADWTDERVERAERARREGGVFGRPGGEREGKQ
jgi:hypothetical protein